MPNPRTPRAAGSVRSPGQGRGRALFGFGGDVRRHGVAWFAGSRHFGSGRAGVPATGATVRGQAIFSAFLDLRRLFLHVLGRCVRFVRDSRIAAQCCAQRRRGTGRTAVDARRRRDKAGDGLIGSEFDCSDTDHRDNECGSTDRPDLDPGLRCELLPQPFGSRFVALGRRAGGQHVAVVSGQSVPASLGDFPQCHVGGRTECSGIESGAHGGNDRAECGADQRPGNAQKGPHQGRGHRGQRRANSLGAT